jgi:hypothetical protein
MSKLGGCFSHGGAQLESSSGGYRALLALWHSCPTFLSSGQCTNPLIINASKQPCYGKKAFAKNNTIKEAGKDHKEPHSEEESGNRIGNGDTRNHTGDMQSSILCSAVLRKAAISYSSQERAFF